jgi:hypothetical protein
MVGHEDAGMQAACRYAAGSQQQVEVKPVSSSAWKDA